ncbi:MarR family winged helix-turn-helix transcriptional regulator [Sulfitobacter sp. F26204]|uniref:MarR family winged helix-turn-helix transcriptional regulator n=1 Tax=Sulfitobacter sp. F26204 TaxID=2996014 RepID=UPI00225E07E2|nr:MarR family winged helix-turn-helix transcriptional regulator [Sulfitobacter sp. F26204]MCX7560262.1 MarR family winged helix-turn-helix transcriptional regulator [Sulfitobacter sp. F26204]
MPFQLESFLPYLLNQAAEAVSADFKQSYRDRYGMLRTEWRVLFHLGVYGQMTAKGICEKATIHKTKISRAVTALEKKRYITKKVASHDRRIEHLNLTDLGEEVFFNLRKSAEEYETKVTEDLDDEELTQLKYLLGRLLVSR